jgi:hypothetical protein
LFVLGHIRDQKMRAVFESGVLGTRST